MSNSIIFPNVSIIIPIKDEKDPFIWNCLYSINNLDYTEQIEVLVIKEGNRAQARNIGILNANFDVIAFIDSDCIAPKEWLKGIVTYLIKTPDVVGVGGPNFSPPKNSDYEKAIDYVFSTYLGSLGSASLFKPSKPVYVDKLACINSIFWRDSLLRIKGFDEEYVLCEDTNLSYKLKRMGNKLLFIPDFFVWHHRKSVLGFFKQFYSYGKGRMRSILTDLIYADLRIMFLFISCLLFPFIIYFLPHLVFFVFIITLLIILFHGIRGCIKLKNPKHLFLIPVFFLIEYISYFLGMFIGILEGRWKKTRNDSKLYIAYTIFNYETINKLSNYGIKK